MKEACSGGPLITKRSVLSSNLFKTSKEPAHKEILRLPRDSPAEIITIVVIGAVTDVALAAAEDLEMSAKAKELVVMRGAVRVGGSITPAAEFNTYPDPVAAARVFALTSLNPRFAIPPISLGASSLLAYPRKLSRCLALALFP